MSRPEYPTSIRLTVIDKRRLRKQADRRKRSLAGLIQMILMQWLEKQEKNSDEGRGHNEVVHGADAGSAGDTSEQR